MRNYRLSNIILNVDDFVSDFPNLYYRSEKPAIYDQENDAFEIYGKTNLITYFNAFSSYKWLKYTVIENLWVHLSVSGDAFDIVHQIVEHSSGGSQIVESFKETFGDSSEFIEIDLELSLQGIVCGIVLDPRSTIQIKDAYYYTKINDSNIREVSLSLCTTTFLKEEYILPNIEAVKREILECDEPIAKNFHMHVVDNGRTLNTELLNSDGVSVHPNANVGGAGGFTRGMLESLKQKNKATHVLLMDDDIRVSTESFKRTFNLLTLRKEEYEDAFINGAMLMLEKPNIQFEDVATVRKDGLYYRIKPDLEIDKLEGIIQNEIIDVELENAYGAWWFCCIPASVIEEKGLPLPLFVRCDDVEYGMRCKPKIMAMNGICVWHASFEGRFRASVDCYQFVRNFLIMTSLHSEISERLFMLRLRRRFDIDLRAMNYESAGLLLDGLEDYLKGPKFIEEANGEQIMKQNGQKNERLAPLSELDQEVINQISIDYDYLGTEDKRGIFLKLLEVIPHDRHLLPNALLRNAPVSVYYSRGAYPGWKTMRRNTLLALDATGENGHIRKMDKDRYRDLKKRYKELTSKYQARKKELQIEYREAMPYLTSEEFWLDYLKQY